jgi:hypothetical protein
VFAANFCPADLDPQLASVLVTLEEAARSPVASLRTLAGRVCAGRDKRMIAAILVGRATHNLILSVEKASSTLKLSGD